MKNYSTFNKQELIDRINNLEIVQVGNTIVTKYNGKILSNTDVSKKYEIFDIKSYLIEKIDEISKNFTISSYYLRITKGIQELELISDTVDINDITFHKVFRILNSSDKSRRLLVSTGLFSSRDNLFYMNKLEGRGLYKKHYKGITKLANDTMDIIINSDSFTTQIKSLSALMDTEVLLSRVKEVIVDDDNKTNNSNFSKFKRVLYMKYRNMVNADNREIDALASSFSTYDFAIPSYDVLCTYLALFSDKDSHILTKECEKIMNITTWATRMDNFRKIVSYI